MANVAWGKKILAVAVLSCLCASIAVPAYAFYYVHGEENVAATSKGVIEVTCTVDETAQGGGMKTSLIIVPEGSTAAACLDESVVSSNSQNGLAAIHDYSVSSLADELSGKQYTCTVHKADSQKPGTHTAFDGSGTEGESTPLERFDSVVFTVA